MNIGPVSDRVVGQFPLSIATSLAFEGGLGIHPDRPVEGKPLLNYEVIWVNLKTIFRNLYNAIERERLSLVKPEEMYEAFLQELDQIQNVVSSESKGRIQIVFYLSDYFGMEFKYPKAIIRGDVTPNQLAYTAAMRSVLSPYVKEHQGQFKAYRLKLTDPEKRKALLLTHYPYDLFTKEFSSYALLESHTGAIKQKHQWYTKYLNGKDLQQLPFREDFMQIFGDQEHFRPLGLGMRKAILELANQYGWSQVTTTDKIRYCLSTMKDKRLYDEIMTFVNH